MKGEASRAGRYGGQITFPAWLAAFLLILLCSGAVPAFAGPPAPGPAPATPPQPVPAFGLSITLNATQFKWYPGRPITASVTVGSTKATGLLANVALVDDTTLAQLGGGDFLICGNATGDCEPVSEIGPNASRRIYIRPRSDTPEPGKYSGSIQLIANEGKSDVAQVTTTYTSDCYIAGGIAVLAFGVFVSFLSTAVIRNRLVRLQMLGAARLIISRLNDIEKRLNARDPKVVADTSTTLSTIDFVRKQLSVTNLDKLKLLPRFYSPDAAGLAGSASFKDMMEKGGGWATVLAHIVNLGFLQIAALSKRMPNPPKPAEDAIALAWPNLDKLAIHASDILEAAPDLSVTDTRIGVEVTSVEKVTAPLGGAPAKGDDWVGVQFALLSFANLAIAAVLTIAVGAYVMVISHSDFGRLSDFWLCFFWGLGLPTLAQLGQATPSSITASMGITLPKVT